MSRKEAAKLSAIIFDMDGVVIDSERHWLTHGRELMARWIPGWSDHDQARVAGLSAEPLYQFLCESYGLSAAREQFIRDYDETVRDVYARHAQLIEGVAPLLEEISKSHLKLALATSSPRRWITVVSDRLGIDRWFDLMVSASDLGCPAKPAPDIYLGAANMLSLTPGECLVVEDSSVGVASARRAGMPVVGFRNGFNESQDLSQATSYLSGFNGAVVSTLAELFLQSLVDEED